MGCAPTLAREWINAMGDRKAPHMRMWGMGGENLSLQDVTLMQRQCPNIFGPMNSYGECSGCFPAGPG